MKKQNAVVVAVGAGSAVAAGSASAALDLSIAAGFTTLQTDFNALMAIVYPVAISITVASGGVWFGEDVHPPFRSLRSVRPSALPPLRGGVRRPSHHA